MLLFDVICTKRIYITPIFFKITSIFCPIIFLFFHNKKAAKLVIAIAPIFTIIDSVKYGTNSFRATYIAAIIAITAGTEREEKDKCIEAGMNDYIPKPIIKGIIEETIQKWVL